MLNVTVSSATMATDSVASLKSHSSDESYSATFAGI